MGAPPVLTETLYVPATGVVAMGMRTEPAVFASNVIAASIAPNRVWVACVKAVVVTTPTGSVTTVGAAINSVVVGNGCAPAALLSNFTITAPSAAFTTEAREDVKKTVY